GCNIFIGHRNGEIYRYRPRVNPDVNDHWLCDYGRFSYERYDTDRVVVPKVRNDDDYLGISTWREALDAVEKAIRGAKKMVVIASANMTTEEAQAAKKAFPNAQFALTVDPIGPIRMKSRFEWLEGTQAAPNYRGVASIVGEGEIPDMNGVDVLYICDAEFSDRAKDPAVIAELRKAKFVIVHSWDATHPLNEVADVLLPGTIHAEKEGTFTNLQGRVQEIHAAYAPKGQAVPDLEIYRRIADALAGEEALARA
ncbi:MAG TPA: molybdopterin-dependent oxidoreductase, partial [Thermoanaerobaculia bacterium]